MRRSRAEGAAPGRAAADYVIVVTPDVSTAVRTGAADIGVEVFEPLPSFGQSASTPVRLLYDEAEIRSKFAGPDLRDTLDRLNEEMVTFRLRQADYDPNFLKPVALEEVSVATAARVSGSRLAAIIPLILILMTITGAVYPAIDLTAGERERGTLETLMVAPVPTVDLIAGKFVVVTLIAILTAVLNLMSFGMTMYFGGMGKLLTGGADFVFPFAAIPWVLLALVPPAVMFSAALLAVCSFARSYKEAQNYIMPVMVAALIPAIVGAMPGTRLEGPMLVMPVANIVALTRELFLGKFEYDKVLWVVMSSMVYAGAAVAAAAKLFGQEAVLFADSGSIKTLFVRRFFKPLPRPSASQALMLAAILYLLVFFTQQLALTGSLLASPIRYVSALALLLVVLMGVVPFLAALYLRIRPQTAFSLAPPPPRAMLAALCLGLSTWVLASAWFAFQQHWLPMLPAMQQEYEKVETLLNGAPLWLALLCLALVPAFVEELFFRGFMLSGLRGPLGSIAAVALVAVTFALFHHSVHRLLITAVLGLALGLLVIRSGSLWPAVLAHMLHNGLSLAVGRAGVVQELTQRLGWPASAECPPLAWILGAGMLTTAGLALCFTLPPPRRLAQLSAASGSEA